MKRSLDPYRGRDPRTIPAYSVVEAAHYLWVPERTLRQWTFGRTFASKAGRRFSPPVVPADPEGRMLSFVNLLELHVLAAIRREHGVDMRKIRQAVDYLARKWDRKHPLIDEEMETDGQDLFVRHLDELVNVSREGQLAMKAVLAAHLKRIERNKQGLAVRLYPYTRQRMIGLPEAPKFVAIDPQVAFGRPVITGSRIPTSEVAARFAAGDSLDTLVREYGREPEEIEEAIRCEWRSAA